jgi:hypothetical protein
MAVAYWSASAVAGSISLLGETSMGATLYIHSTRLWGGRTPPNIFGSSIERRIDALEQAMSTVKQELIALGQRMTTLEQRISDGIKSK